MRIGLLIFRDQLLPFRITIYLPCLRAASEDINNQASRSPVTVPGRHVVASPLLLVLFIDPLESESDRDSATDCVQLPSAIQIIHF